MWVSGSSDRLRSSIVGQVEWISDSNTVVAAGADGTVALYDVDRDVLRGPQYPGGGGRDGHWPRVRHADPDAELVTIAQDAPGQVYPMDVDSWLAQLAIAGRDLTPEEWARYVPGRSYDPHATGPRRGHVARQSSPTDFPRRRQDCAVVVASRPARRRTSARRIPASTAGRPLPAVVGLWALWVR